MYKRQIQTYITCLELFGTGTPQLKVVLEIDRSFNPPLIKLNTSLDLTEETISGNIAVSNPNYNFTGNKVFTALDVSSADRTTSSGYKSSKTGFSLGTEFEQYENLFFSPELDLTVEDLTTNSTASKTLSNNSVAVIMNFAALSEMM